MNRFRVLALAVFIIWLLATVTTPAQAAAPGGACSKIGTTVKSGSKILICKASGKKKIWTVKSVASSKPLPSQIPEKIWTSVCEEDSNVPPEWKFVQTYLRSLNSCEAPFRLLPVSLSTQTPGSTISSRDALQRLEVCKVKNQRTNGNYTGFSGSGNFPFGAHPGPNTRFQILPIQTLDSAVPSESPLIEYASYFRFIETVLEYISDGPSDVTFSSPENYIKMNVNLASYDIGVHGAPTPLGRQFFDEAIKAGDSVIDYSKTDYVILVIPAKSKPTLLGDQPYASGRSAEGQIENMFSLMPPSGANELGNRTYKGLHPLGVFHELYHGGLGLDDHYGNQEWRPGTGLGMGNWGLMSTIKTDLGGWEKWLVGFTLDSQVRCADSNITSTHWIIPGGVKSTKEKLLVVPLSSSKVIVVESIRPAGLNFKVPKVSQGALVYTVDVSDQRHGYGLQLIEPEGRILESESGIERFVGASAPLKLNEFVIVEGVKIKVVEAGTYGDVIQVSKN